MLATKDNIDFKKVNRNLKKELSELGFEISNQSCMNLLSRALGYKNYNTYLGMNSKIVNNQRESIKDYLINEINLDRINHLKRKSYYNDVIHNDLLDLIDAIYNDREILSNIIKNYPVEVLKEKYDSAVSEFFFIMV